MASVSYKNRESDQKGRFFLHFLAQIEPIIQIFFVILHRFTKKTMETAREILQFLHYHPLSS